MEVQFHPDAWAELAEITAFIGQDSPTNAARVRARIIAAAERLGLFPGMGQAGRLPGTRRLVVPHPPYILAYTVHDDIVHILGVFHGRQDLA